MNECIYVQVCTRAYINYVILHTLQGTKFIQINHDLRVYNIYIKCDTNILEVLQKIKLQECKHITLKYTILKLKKKLP